MTELNCNDISPLDKFELVCLDFDGLLVDTEPIHYLAYKKMLSNRGIDLNLDFLSYSMYAHDVTGKSLGNYVLEKNQSIKDWDQLRIEKQAIYTEIITNSQIKLMEGVDEFFKYLKKRKILMCVVTNSMVGDTNIIRKQLPILNQIPIWLTKDMYARGKPYPDGYLCALKHFQNIRSEKVVGLDDTLKGISAMQLANIFPILVCSKDHPQLKIKSTITHFFSLKNILIS